MKIEGYSIPNEETKRMYAVYDACELASVPIPEAVLRFFDFKEPQPLGKEISIECAIHDFQIAGRKGVDISLHRLPEGIKIIRIYFY